MDQGLAQKARVNNRPKHSGPGQGRKQNMYT